MKICQVYSWFLAGTFCQRDFAVHPVNTQLTAYTTLQSDHEVGSVRVHKVSVCRQHSNDDWCGGEQQRSAAPCGLWGNTSVEVLLVDLSRFRSDFVGHNVSLSSRMFIIIHVNDARMKPIIYLLACAARCPMWTGQLIWSYKLTTLPWCTVGGTRASRASREPSKWHINSCGLISLDKQKYIRIKLMDECLFGHSIQIKVNKASQRTPFLSSYINSQTCLLKGNENTKDYKLGVWTTKRVQPTPPPPIVSLHSRRDQQIRMENNRTDFSRRFWRERVATFYLLTFKLAQKPLMFRYRAFLSSSSLSYIP